MLCWRTWWGKAQPPVAVQCQDFLLWPQGEGGLPSPAVDALGPARSQGTATTRPRVGWFRRGNYTGYAALAAYRGGRLTGFRRLAYKARCAGRISRNGVPAPKRHYPAPGHCAGFSFGAVSKTLVSKPVSMERAFLAQGKQPPVNTAVNSETPHLRRVFPSRGFQGVSTETGICWTGYQCWLPSWFPRKPTFSGGWLTARLTARLTALLELQKTSVSSRGFQAGFHGIGHFLDGYRAWLQGRLQRNHGFLIGTHGPGTQAGTHEKAPFCWR